MPGSSPIRCVSSPSICFWSLVELVIGHWSLSLFTAPWINLGLAISGFRTELLMTND